MGGVHRVPTAKTVLPQIERWFPWLGFSGPAEFQRTEWTCRLLMFSLKMPTSPGHGAGCHGPLASARSLVSGGCCTCSSRNRKDGTDPALAPRSHLTQEAGQGEAPFLFLRKSKQDANLYFPHNVPCTSQSGQLPAPLSWGKHNIGHSFQVAQGFKPCGAVCSLGSA